MNATVIVNIRHRRADVLCDRSSLFGNPYEIGRDGTRDEVCDKYQELFYQKVLNDPAFRDKILKLKGKKLGCWCQCDPPCNYAKCKPLRCHVQTIVNFINSYYETVRKVEN